MKTELDLIRACLLCAGLLLQNGVKAQPIVTQQPTNMAVAVGSNAIFSVGVTGSGPFTYQWGSNNKDLASGILSTLRKSSGPGDDPSGLAVDNQGNLFFTTFLGCQLIKLKRDGSSTIVAGNGARGYSGDGGAATSAKLNLPNGIAIDSNGNLFIADTYNDRVRKVSNSGIITTIAGNGFNGSTGDGGYATNASLNRPLAVAVDVTGNVYVAAGLIRKVSTNGIITRVATNLFLSYPTAIALDAGGNLFILDCNGSRIYKVNTNGIVTTIAGTGLNDYSGDGGAATNASLKRIFQNLLLIGGWK